MIKIVNNINDANCITHAGNFHADDLFSTVFLSKIIKEVRVIRLNDYSSPDQSQKIVYDIGKGKFDHHQRDARVRENKIKYSSFGLLFEEYGKKYLKDIGIKEIDQGYQRFLDQLVFQIDAIDNGVFPEQNTSYEISALSNVLEWFNPTWNEEKTSDEAFLEAIQCTEQIFDRIENRIKSEIEAIDLVNTKIDSVENHILILEKHLPYLKAILESNNPKAQDINFVIMPSNRGGYTIQTVRKNNQTYETRKDLRKEWGGKDAKTLQEITHIPTFTFCHPNLFCASTQTLEDAIKVAKLAMEKE